jgi:hypothetical protein
MNELQRREMQVKRIQAEREEREKMNQAAS